MKLATWFYKHFLPSKSTQNYLKAPKPTTRGWGFKGMVWGDGDWLWEGFQEVSVIKYDEKV